MPRDYVSEMDAIFTKFTNPDGSYILRDVAAKITAWCEQNDPELLDGWLKLQAQDMIWTSLNRRDQTDRLKSQRGTRHAVFAAALEAAGNGDYAPAKAQLSMLDAPFSVDSNHQRKRYRNMTRDEVLHVAGTYGRMENISRLRRVFHETVAAKLADGETVGDVFNATSLYQVQQELGLDD